MGFAISVAATKNDWVRLFQHVKGADTIRFYKSYSFEPLKSPIDSIAAIPGIGVSESAAMILTPSYMAITDEQTLRWRRINRNDGSVIYDADQHIETGNPDSFRIFPGGVFEKEFFIVGEIDSLYSGGESAHLIAKRLIGRIRRSFHRGSFFWIGPECFEQYNSTHVFTQDARYFTDPRPGINTQF